MQSQSYFHALAPLAFSLCLSIGSTVLSPAYAQTAETMAEDSSSPKALQSADPASSTKEEFPSGLVSLSNLNVYSQFTFIVDKSKRVLRVYEWKNDLPELVNEFPADFGKKSGDKTKENDHRTPVGIYFLQKEMTQPEIPFNLYGNLAFSMDYPNIFDKRDAKTGHGIWLHAVPDNVPLTRGSRGCVVVRNDVIKSLKKIIKLEQTPVLIFDSVQYLSKQEYQQQRKSFLSEFENWRIAWETQDVDTYIRYYADTFRNDEMNYKQWYRHKKKLKELYSFIKVELSEPLILINKDMVVIRTIQRYQSNLHKDYGEKTIHAKYSPENGFKIIREAWRPLQDPLVKSESSNSPLLETTKAANAAPHDRVNTN